MTPGWLKAALQEVGVWARHNPVEALELRKAGGRFHAEEQRRTAELVADATKRESK